CARASNSYYYAMDYW
nr:immunoglobulin heavy chain junction region [Mus musculus]NSM03704.1 immunoglobulin heavy chain junction region [Mus musculus]NSM03806.1 immunoglobulin heavy chain junction region [Mus musculus]NSM03813.1 immunoglobulin heavy chain junction region [Mus musculus]NSM03832.1 immunoglobulin heavy chain junction region [Mus musculus]